MNDDRLLTEEQTAKLLSLQQSTLRTWRIRRKGPSFVKLGGAVRYPEGAVRAFRDKGLVVLGED